MRSVRRFKFRREFAETRIRKCKPRVRRVVPRLSETTFFPCCRAEGGERKASSTPPHLRPEEFEEPKQQQSRTADSRDDDTHHAESSVDDTGSGRHLLRVGGITFAETALTKEQKPGRPLMGAATKASYSRVIRRHDDGWETSQRRRPAKARTPVWA